MPLKMQEKYAASIKEAEKSLWTWRFPKPIEMMDEKAEKSTSELQSKKAVFFGYLVEQCELAISNRHNTQKSNSAALHIQAKIEARKAATAAKKLKTFIENHELASWQSVASAMLQTGVHLRRKEDEEPIEHGVASFINYPNRLALLLESMAKQLSEGVVAPPDGNFSYRYKVGPLIFPGPLKGRAHLPTLAICHAYYLSVLIRNFTTIVKREIPETKSKDGTITPGRTIKVGNCSGRRPNPDQVIKLGQRHWNLVRTLVKDAPLHIDINPQDVAKMVRRHPNVGILNYSQEGIVMQKIE